MHEIRPALRQLRKHPGFTAVALITLALGIGANTAIFSIVDALLVRPLPVPHPGRLAVIAQESRAGRPDYEFNYPLFLDYQRENTVFSHLSATANQSVGLGIGGATERQEAALVSGNYFSMLGVNAALGRTFAQGEGRAINDAPVVVLSHGLWVRRFGADPGVIERTVTINGQPFNIVGVAPREFTGAVRGVVPDLYLPITELGRISSDRPGGSHPLETRYLTWHHIMGRLKDGVSHAEAQNAMRHLALQIHAVHPANLSTNPVVLAGAQGFSNHLGDVRLPLQLLLGAAALVLLIACANLANLQLTRAGGRTREFAIRLALGARRMHLIRGLLAESLMLSLGGGLLGLVVAVGLTRVFLGFRPGETPGDIGAHLDLRVLAFAFTLAVLTGVLFGLAPALRASRPQLVPEIKGANGNPGERAARWNLRGILVVAQVALSLLVLVGAGLCVRSLQKLQDLDPGFEPSRVALVSFDLGHNNYTPARSKDFRDQLLERTRTLPGVESVSLSANTPLTGSAWNSSFERLEGVESGPRNRPVGEINIVSPGYFRTLGIRFLRGRDFSGIDAADGAPVAIINDAFARRYWPGQDPVGKRIYQHGPNGGTPTEVIGIVEATRGRRLSDSPRPTVFFPLAQRPELALTIAVRSALPAAGILAGIREGVRAIDPHLPTFRARSLAQQKDGSLALQRMAANLLGGFGFVALALAAVGIYGVLAFFVSRRIREIGIRMALGARGGDVLSLVLRQGIRLAGVGIGLGLMGSLATTRLLRGFLFDVEPIDPATFSAVTCLLAAVSLLACWFPARRATRVDPMVALRAE